MAIRFPSYQNKKTPWFDYANGPEVDRLVAHIARIARDPDQLHLLANDLKYSTRDLHRDAVWAPAEDAMWKYSRSIGANYLGQDVAEWVKHFARGLHRSVGDPTLARYPDAIGIEADLSRPLIALTLYPEAPDLMRLEPDALKIFVVGGIPAAALLYPLVDALHKHRSRHEHQIAQA